MRGGFLLGDTLYYGFDDGAMYKRTFNGTSVGAATKLDPYHDPLWMLVNNGSGGTYDGSTSAFYTAIPNVTGMFYTNGRIYYTRTGASTLSWRAFNADSGIVGAYENDASGGRSWTGTQGLFYAGGTVYRALASTGALLAYPMSNGVPTGAGVPVGSGVDWRGRTLFVGDPTGATPPPPPPPAENQPPTAAFTQSCTTLTCTFDARTSTDPEGAALTYGWDFGESASADNTATGVTASHTYAAAGTYSVTLTVTDPDGLASTSTQSVVVSDTPTEPPSGGTVTPLGQSATSVSSATPTLTLPTGLQDGDRLLLTGTYNAAGVNATTPSGWTLVRSDTTTAASSYLWTKVATAADSGSTVTTTLPARAKASLTALAYRGVDATGTPTAALATEAGTTSHTTPTLQVSARSFVVESWQVKSAAAVAWSAPAGTTARIQTTGSGAGQTSVLDADAGMVDAGSAGGHTATSSVSTSRGVTWTIALTPAAGP